MTVPQDPGAAPGPSTDARSDRELMAAHVDGDRGAFPELITRHRSRMWTLALRTLRDREDAGDALQDGCVRAFRAAHTYRGDSEVATWLHRIVLNVCLNKIQARERRGTVPLDDQVDDEHRSDLVDARDAFADVDARGAAAQLLARLPDEQRLAIVLVDVEGYSVAEAADALGVAAGTIKSRCARGRARLAAALSSAGTAGRAGTGPGHTLRTQHDNRGGQQR